MPHTPLQKMQTKKIAFRQRKRGVIPSIRGKKTPLRNKLSAAIKFARKTGKRWDLFYPVEPKIHYDSVSRKFHPNFSLYVENKLKIIRSMQKRHPSVRLRWLDIGHGQPENFMPYFRQLDPNRSMIDLHTLSPDQINLEKVYAKTEHAVRDNPEYDPALKHHVGAIETYDLRKLKGKFDVIVSTLGGVFFSANERETMLKVARLLNPDGMAFLDAEVNSELLDDVQRKLGKNFIVIPIEPRGYSDLISPIRRFMIHRKLSK